MQNQWWGERACFVPRTRILVFAARGKEGEAKRKTPPRQSGSGALSINQGRESPGGVAGGWRGGRSGSTRAGGGGGRGEGGGTETKASAPGRGWVEGQVCVPGGLSSRRCVGPGTERPRLPGLAQSLQGCHADPTRWAWVCRSASRQVQSVCSPHLPSTPYHSHGNLRLPRRPSSFPLVSGLRPPGVRGSAAAAHSPACRPPASGPLSVAAALGGASESV